MLARRHRFGRGISLDARSGTTLAEAVGLPRRGCLRAFAFGSLRLGLLVGELELGGLRVKLGRPRIGASCLFISPCLEVGPTEHPPALDVLWCGLEPGC